MTKKNIIPVCFYTIAMAYLESATVVYLRRVFNISDLILDIPSFDQALALIEIGREFATLVMLFAVGWAAGRSLQSRISYTFIIFGMWDIFYYFWLRVFIGWPRSLLAPDILFLIPLPWWGPVIAPVLIACLMVVGGILAIIAEDKGRKIKFFITEGAALISGVLILLYSFMQDAISILPADAETLSRLRPSDFNWLIYFTGLIFAGYGVLHTVWAAQSEPITKGGNHVKYQ